MANKSGFRAWNDDGLCQIDSDYSNLGLIKKTKVTCNALVSGSFQNGRYRGTTTVTCDEAIVVACRNPIENNPFFVANVSQSGNQWTILVEGGLNQVIEVYIFGPPLHTAGKSGLNIYKADGTLAFTSEHPYMKIAEVHNLDGKYPEYYYRGLPTSTYAITQVMPVQFASRIQVGPMPTSALFVPFYNAISTGLLIRYAPRNQLAGSPVEAARPLKGNVLIIDVSKYDQVPWT